MANAFERGKSEGVLESFYFASQEPFGVLTCASSYSRLSIDCNHDLDVSSMNFFSWSSILFPSHPIRDLHNVGVSYMFALRCMYVFELPHVSMIRLLATNLCMVENGDL